MKALLGPLAATEVADLCRRHRLSYEWLGEPLCRVPIHTATQMLDRVAAHAQDPLAGLRLGQQGRPYGLLHYTLISQPTFGAALHQLVQFRHLLLSDSEIRLTHRNRRSALILWPTLPPRHRHVAEACLAILSLIFREATDSALRFEEIHLRARACALPAEYEQLFGCPVRFEQPAHALVFATKAMETRLPQHNPQVAACLEQEAQLEGKIHSSPSVHRRVEVVIAEALRAGESYARETIARRLLLSPRTLQRRLEGEGMSFREIEDAVRRDYTFELASDAQLTLCEVATRCGFSDLSALNKAFKRWTGRAPSVYRNLRAAVNS